jgi:hypothetical protein
LLAFLASAFGKRTFGPSFDPGKLDGLSSGLRRLYRRELLRTPSTLLRLSRVKQAYATMFLRHEVVLSPVRRDGRRAADRRAALGRVRRRADAVGAGVRTRTGPALAAHPGLTAALCSA